MEEIYFNQEIAEVVTQTDINEEWLAKIEALGLVGQQKIVGKVATVSTSPVPFPQLNNSMFRVYKELCPRRVEVKSYSGSPMPMRVIEALALCVKENYFEEIEVWSDEQDPGPILVGGGKYLGNYFTDEPQYIIARWGDELCSFAELKARATKRWIENKGAQAKIKIEECQLLLATIEAKAVQYFNGGNDDLPF